MRTITEFNATHIRNLIEKKKELVAAGKTEEELPAALSEALKIEGDKLTMLTNAAEVVGEKHKDLKRVVVLAPNEGETAPSGLQGKGDHFFNIEYYQSQKAAAPSRDEGRRDGKRGGRGDKKGGGRGGRPGERGGERGPRGPGGPGGANAGGRPAGGAGGPGGDRGPRRAPLPAGPAKPLVLPKPRNTNPAPAAASEAPAASDSASDKS